MNRIKMNYKYLHLCAGNMFLFIILSASLFTKIVVSQSVSIPNHDIALTIDETKNFSLILSEEVPEDVYINFNFDNPGIINITSVNSMFLANTTSAPLIFTIYPLEAGKTTVFTNATDSSRNISTSDAFIRVSVIKFQSLEVVSVIVGWIYFVAWSISFYPQAYTNFKRKSVAGLNFDFVGLNITGFLAYSFFNIGLYFSPVVQKEYLSGHPAGVIPVELNDVVFGVHAAFATVLQIIQCFIYERDGQRVSNVARAILSLIWVIGIVFLIVTLAGGNKHQPWLTFLYYFSYCKLGITIIKYIPQAYFNFRRKSTEGWSIGNILLDFAGGMLSMLQMFIIAYNYNDWDSLFGNPTKFGLGFFSILFDILFMIQHYCLYKTHNVELNLLCDNKLTT